MDKNETLKSLVSIEKYFTIHGWCTQTNEKISNFMSNLDEQSKTWVEKWAYEALQQNNVKNPTRILAIILLKLLSIPDRELIRLLYTVMHGTLTFEDFNNLNLYIFDGKPPLSPDLFYNITERVFMDKKSALKKALSITSIVTEADPDLTVFYMTMILCRVDLNNENRAMLNMLLYCLDASVPEEVTNGVKDYLLSIADLLNEIVDESGNKEAKGILNTLYDSDLYNSEKENFPTAPTISLKITPMDSDTSKPMVQSVEKEKIKPTTPSLNNYENSKGNKKSTINNKGVSKTSPNLVGKPETYPKKIKYPTNPLTNKEISKKINKDTQEANPKNVITSQSVDFKKNNNTLVSSEMTKVNDLNQSEITGKFGIAATTADKTNSSNTGLDKTDNIKEKSKINKIPKTYNKTDEIVTSPDKYVLKVRKFSIVDLLTNRKAQVKRANTPGKVKTTKDNKRHHTPGQALGPSSNKKIYFLIAAFLFILIGTAAFFMVSQTKNKETAGLNPEIKKDVNIASSITAEMKKDTNIASSVAENQKKPVIKEGWNLNVTNDGVFWTVKKGESVWKLYLYLANNIDTIPDQLKNIVEKGWLPFIHQVIRLNPNKSFAEPIEPGDIYLIN